MLRCKSTTRRLALAALFFGCALPLLAGPVHGQVVTLRPDGDIRNRGGLWFNESGRPLFLMDCIDEASADDFTTYITHEGSLTTWTLYETSLSNPTCTPSDRSDGSHVLTYRWLHLPSGAEEEHMVDFRVQLREGRRLIAVGRHNKMSPSGSFAFTTSTLSLTADQAASIVDYNNLRIRFYVRVRIPGTEDAQIFLYVTQAYLDIPDFP